MTMAMHKPSRGIKEEPTYLNLGNEPGELDALTGQFSKVSIAESAPEPTKRNTSLKKDRYEPKKPEEPTKIVPAADVLVKDHAPGSPSHHYLQQFQQQQYQNLQQQAPLYQPGQKRSANNQYYNLTTDNTPKAGNFEPQHDTYRRQMMMRNGFARTEDRPVENVDPSANYFYMNQPNGCPADYYNIPQQQIFTNTPVNKAPMAGPRPGSTQTHVNDNSLEDLGHNVSDILKDLVETPRLDDPTIPTTVDRFHSGGANRQNSHEYVNQNSQRQRQSSSSSSISTSYKSAASPVSVYNAAHQQPFSPPQSTNQYVNYNSPSPLSAYGGKMMSPNQHQYHNMVPSPDHNSSSVGSPQTVPSPSQCNLGNTSPGFNDQYSGMYDLTDPAMPKMFDADRTQLNSLGVALEALNGSCQLPNMDKENINDPIYHNLGAPQQQQQQQNRMPQPFQQPQTQPTIDANKTPFYHNMNGGYYNTGPNSGYINQQTSTMGMTQPQTQSMYMPAMSDYVNLPPATALSTVAPAVTKALTSPPMTSTAPTTAGSAPVDKVAIPRLVPQKPEAPVQPTYIYVIVPPNQEPAAPPKPRAIAPKPADGDAAPQKEEKKKKTGKKTGKKSSKKNAEDNGDPKDGTAQKTPQQLRQQAARLVQNTTDEKLLMINESGESTLHTAIRKNQLHVVTALLEASVRRPGLMPLINMVNAKGQTPLFMLVTSGYDRTGMITELLVKNLRADCNRLCQYENGAGGSERISVLHYVSKYGDRCMRDLKTILQSRNVDINLRNSDGVTALHLALWNHGQTDIKTRGKIDSTKVVSTLLQSGAQSHTEELRSGKTALHFAVETGSLDLTKLILENCAVPETLIDSKNFDRRTPLHVAVLLSPATLSEDNKIDLVRYLLSKGASKSIKDKDRMTPSSLVQATQSRLLEVFDDGLNSPATAIYSDDDSYGSPGGLLSP